jgi:hypothetical protein
LRQEGNRIDETKKIRDRTEEVSVREGESGEGEERGKD